MTKTAPMNVKGTKVMKPRKEATALSRMPCSHLPKNFMLRDEDEQIFPKEDLLDIAQNIDLRKKSSLLEHIPLLNGIRGKISGRRAHAKHPKPPNHVIVADIFGKNALLSSGCSGGYH